MAAPPPQRDAHVRAYHRRMAPHALNIQSIYRSKLARRADDERYFQDRWSGWKDVNQWHWGKVEDELNDLGQLTWPREIVGHVNAEIEGRVPVETTVGLGQRVFFEQPAYQVNPIRRAQWHAYGDAAHAVMEDIHTETAHRRARLNNLAYYLQFHRRHGTPVTLEQALERAQSLSPRTHFREMYEDVDYLPDESIIAQGFPWNQSNV